MPMVLFHLTSVRRLVCQCKTESFRLYQRIVYDLFTGTTDRGTQRPIAGDR
jgi:hypothetical protein